MLCDLQLKKRHIAGARHTVLVSAENTIAATAAAMRAGAVDSIPKPRRAAELVQIIARVEKERRRARDEAPSITRMEERYYRKIVDLCDANISKAAEILRVNRSTVQRVLGRNRPRR